MPRHRLPYAPVSRPLVYWPLPWCQDVVNGSRDAHHGLPGDDGDGVTPHIETLTRGFEDRAHREWIRTARSVAPLLARQSGEAAAVDELVGTLDDARRRLERTGEEPTADEQAERRLGETDTDPALVRQRRRREHRARTAPILAAIERHEAQLRTVRTALARTDRLVAIRVEFGAARVARLHAHTLRRVGTYERRLLRSHPSPDGLRARLELARPVLPEWARTERAALPL